AGATGRRRRCRGSRSGRSASRPTPRPTRRGRATSGVVRGTSVFPPELLSHHGGVVEDSPVVESVGFHVVELAAVGRFELHAGIVSIDDLQGAATRAAPAVFWLDLHADSSFLGKDRLRQEDDATWVARRKPAPGQMAVQVTGRAATPRKLDLLS